MQGLGVAGSVARRACLSRKHKQDTEQRPTVKPETVLYLWKSPLTTVNNLIQSV